MKNIIICLLFINVIYLLSFPAYSYDRNATIKYADKYDTWTSGHDGFVYYLEDCANFASQCLIAGNMDLFHFYSTWPRGGNNTFKNTGGLFYWLKNNNFIEKEEERAEGLPTYRDYLEKGDIIFVWAHNSLYHTLVVVDKQTNPDKIIVASHTSGWAGASEWDELDAFKNYRFFYFHLKDAPIIKQIKVTQKQGPADEVVYKWNYDGEEGQEKYDPANTTGEYYKHTYKGLQKAIENEKIVNFNNEALKFEIIFDDESMKTSGQEVFYEKYAPHIVQNASNFTWADLLHTNDKLICEADVPMDINLAEDISNISINAYSEMGGKDFQIDEDGELTSYSPGKNVEHRILLPLLEIDKAEKKTVNNQDVYLIYGDVNLQVKGLDNHWDVNGYATDLYVKFEDEAGNIIYDRNNPTLDKDDFPPYKITFNTKQKAGAAANVDAINAADAKYEGKKIKIEAKVFQRDSGSGSDKELGSPTTKGIIKGATQPEFPFDADYTTAPGLSKELLIDNFTPFIKKVLVYQPQIVNLEDVYSGHYNAGQMGGYYEAEWVWNANLNKYELKEIGDSNGFRNDYAVKIKLEFSESMDTYDYVHNTIKQPEIRIIFSGNRDGGLITGGGWLNNRTYEVETDANYITGDVLATGESRSKDGIAILEVKAEDLTESATVGNNQNILKKGCENV